MPGPSVHQKYPSLLQQGEGIRGQAEVTHIGEKSLELTRRGNRLVWTTGLLDQGQHLTNGSKKERELPPAGSKGKRCVSSVKICLATIQLASKRKYAAKKIQRLERIRDPLRVKHLRRLLKETDAEIDLTDIRIANLSRRTNRPGAGIKAASI